mmetsp:Transcript_105054/g.186121  ORF Transcript_105054/g.186121 Transcript_105054/m.186121 type:complete len:279 (-) Transcript_105054:520-1356(-)
MTSQGAVPMSGTAVVLETDETTVTAAAVTIAAVVIVVVAVAEAAKTEDVLVAKVGAEGTRRGEAAVHAIRATAAAPVTVAVEAAAAAVAVVVAARGACAVAGGVEETAVTVPSVVIVEETAEIVQSVRMANEGAGVESVAAAADGGILKGGALALEVGKDGGAVKASAAGLTAAVRAVTVLMRSAPAEVEASVHARRSPRARSLPRIARRRRRRDPTAAAPAQSCRNGKGVLRLQLPKRLAAAVTTVPSGSRSGKPWRRRQVIRWRPQGRQLRITRWP